MVSTEERQKIIALINKEVVPAVGCTEPMAVALCVSKAAELLSLRPERITARLSANILKNAMGVGIPGTGMIGLPIAIALGALVGKSEYELSVLKDITPQAVDEAKEYMLSTPIEIESKDDIQEKLYIEIEVYAQSHTAKAVIAVEHTRFVFLQRDEEVLLNEEFHSHEEEDDDLPLNLQLVYDFATTAPLDEISFILKTKEYNLHAAQESRKGNYGHCLGKTIDRPLAHGIFGNSIFSHIISATASACDARMGGALIPVMCNSGSGNQGICATNPVAVYALENENTEEETIRALLLSHLTAIYIKQNLGKLSALCGCVVASIGSSCGITYLMGGDFNNICSSVKNMIANLTGMICDGAKPSCALKISSGVSTALLSAVLSMEGKCVSSAEGIIDESVDQSIRNLTSIGAEAMQLTDKKVVEIMSKKGAC